MRTEDWSWDVFIAYASADEDKAEELHRYLASECRVFIASKNIEPGQEWDRILTRAQRSSRFTVVLVSSSTDESYYQREEIAQAIQLARPDDDNHRVIPIYLEGQLADNSDVPYGLRIRHGFAIDDETTLRSIADRILATAYTSPTHKSEPIGAADDGQPNGKVTGEQPNQSSRWPTRRPGQLGVAAVIAVVLVGVASMAYLLLVEPGPARTEAAGGYTSPSSTPSAKPPPTSSSPSSQAPNSDRVTYTGHRDHANDAESDAVFALTELSNGWIVSGGSDETLQVWDPSDPAKTIATYIGHSGVVLAVIELADGRVASAGRDKTVQIWTPTRVEDPPIVYRGHSEDVEALLLLADGRIASSGRDKTVQIWSPENADVTETSYLGHSDNVRALIQLSDGNIASASWDKTTRVWNPANPDQTLSVYTGHTDHVRFLAELSDHSIASTSRDKTVQIWEPYLPGRTLTTYRGHDELVLAVLELSSGLMVSAGWDDTVQIWSRDTPQATLFTYRGHIDNVEAVIELRDGRIASASSDGTVQVWELPPFD